MRGSAPDTNLDRRALLGGLGLAAALGLAAPLRAVGPAGTGLAGTGLGAGALGPGLRDLLGRAADSSLDKLGQPGAFYTDPAVRIALPLIGKAASGGTGGVGGGLGTSLLGLLDKGQQLGLTDNLVRKLNDAAGSAAREAKPIFRSAIGRLSLADVPGIATRRDGATQYLRGTAGTDLGLKLRPLVDRGLASVGALTELDRLSAGSSLLRSAGITRDRIGASVTEQALNGIFRYIGIEEGRLRDNPAGAIGGVLKGLLGN